jgi:hypothetical protein
VRVEVDDGAALGGVRREGHERVPEVQERGHGTQLEIPGWRAGEAGAEAADGHQDAREVPDVEPTAEQRGGADGQARPGRRGDGDAYRGDRQEVRHGGVPVVHGGGRPVGGIEVQRQRQQPEEAQEDAGEPEGDGPLEVQEVQRRQHRRERKEGGDERDPEQPPAAGEQTGEVRRGDDGGVAGQVRRQMRRGPVDEVGGVHRDRRGLGVPEDVGLTRAGREREHREEGERDRGEQARVDEGAPGVQRRPDAGLERRTST